jgi:3-carboxy-cis,cis-muconate cycloisomerase
MLFSPLFVPSPLAEAVGDRAWLQAMLDAEAALARAEARAGMIPTSAAEAIASCCSADRFEADTISFQARQVGNPVEPLVRALRGLVAGDAAHHVHYGTTSQDILDTAGMLIVRRTLILIEDDLACLTGLLVRLADEHRQTLMVGRTLLQHALPTTFGLKAAHWLAGVLRARTVLLRLHDDVLAVELGGAAGTLASLGAAGVTVLHDFAEQLQLAEPTLPWHTERTRIVEIGAALALVSGSLDKIALDVVLLAQTEVGEVSEGGDGRRGGSSTLPHKRNPVGAVLTRACVREAQANAEVLMRTMAQEHERAAGAWHSEWQALSAALAFTGGAAAWLREVLEGLEVRPERMRENLESTHGLIMSEHVVSLLATRMGREEANDLVRSLSRRASDGRESLKEILLGDPTVSKHLSPDAIERAMDPASYLGSAGTFIDRTLALYQSGETA